MMVSPALLAERIKLPGNRSELSKTLLNEYNRLAMSALTSRSDTIDESSSAPPPLFLTNRGLGEADDDVLELWPESARSSVSLCWLLLPAPVAVMVIVAAPEEEEEAPFVILHDDDEVEIEEPWPLEHKLEQLLMLLLHR